MMYDWQKLDRSFRAGAKKGELIMFSQQRQMGKSMFNALDYLSAWGKWVPVQTILARKSISGKKIRGRIMMRKHKLAMSGNGESWTQYATKKEAFVESLKDG